MRTILDADERGDGLYRRDEGAPRRIDQGPRAGDLCADRSAPGRSRL